jgi:hypothetical protein
MCDFAGQLSDFPTEIRTIKSRTYIAGAAKTIRANRGKPTMLVQSERRWSRRTLAEDGQDVVMLAED